MENINEELNLWAKEFYDYHIPRWDDLPNIDYYMDQVIEYINRYVGIFCIDDTKSITSSMINNYVKLGLLPAPIKKKYSKNHVSNLIVITILKQLTVISQIKDAVHFQIKLNGGKSAYNIFCEEIENAVKRIYLIVNNKKIEINEEISLENMAVKSISNALAYKMLAVKITNMSKENI